MFAFSRKLLKFVCLVQIGSLFSCKMSAYCRPTEPYESNDYLDMLRARRTEPAGNTIFEQIIRKEVSADIIYEDDQCLSFHDVNPQAPVHVLLVPKRRIEKLSLSHPSDQSALGYLLFVASRVARILGLKDGYRVVVNDGKYGGQTVDYLHLHILGGRQMKWPPG